MRAQVLRLLAFAIALCVSSAAFAQTGAPPQGPVRITLDDAIQMALQHNHNLLAARTTIQQNEAYEITANLRPNPVLSGDAQFLPIFQPNKFNDDYINTTAQFDVGVGYLFERGRKRQHRLQAARDVTASNTFDGGGQRAQPDLSRRHAILRCATRRIDDRSGRGRPEKFQNTVDISQSRYNAGDISEVDFLKIKIQLLQFQTDMSQAQLAKVQALAALRQLLGYESVSADYDVAGAFDYQPVTMKLEDLQAKALAERPDLRAARQGVTAANSQYELQKANGKVDPTATINYSHVSDTSSASLFANVQIPIFNRNQGEIAKAQYAITQAQELAHAASDQVMTDVMDAYEGVRTNDQIVTLYRSGYLEDAQDSRDISEYAYKRGAASLLDYLDAERSYRATNLRTGNRSRRICTAVEQLREAVGTRNLP